MELDVATGRVLLNFDFHDDLRRQRHRLERSDAALKEAECNEAASVAEEERLLTGQLVSRLGTGPQMAPAPGDLRPPPEEVKGQQPLDMPACLSELPPSLTRRARQSRPVAPRPGLAHPKAGGLQLPLIGGAQRRRSEPFRVDMRGSRNDRLAALTPGQRQVAPGALAVRVSDDGRLARLSTRSGKTPVSAGASDSHLLRLESAEDEGRSEGAPSAGSRRPFTAVAGPAGRPSRSSSSSSASRYVVINGRTRTDAADFQAFRQLHRSDWGCVASAMLGMERFLNAYSIPIAFVNGEKLAALAETLEFDARNPRRDELLDCLINRSDVARLAAQPGRRFGGQGGAHEACVLIQAHWRGFLQQRRYQEFRRRCWAAGVIAVQWLIHVRIGALRSRLCDSRAAYLEGYRRRFKQLSTCWSEWQRQRRVIIHLPSLGYPQSARQRMADLDRLQNTQMARLCDIQDPNVDVVLLCPLPLSPELAQYYSRLTALQAAIQSGKAEDQKDTSQRFRIVVPEAVGQFPQHNLCLSTLLNYSPKALSQLRDIISGRRAYIVPGLPCADDLAVADQLDVPILCPEPDLVRKFGTASGSRELLEVAQLPTPPGEAGITSLPHLAECLARLITSNLDIRRWRLRLNDFPTLPDDSHTASLDTERLACYQWALDERKRFGDRWSKLWAQERVYIKVMDELLTSAMAQQVQSEFLALFSSHGGSVEAQPGVENVTRIMVDLCVEPTGTIRFVSSGDRIGDTGPVCVPQSTLSPLLLSNLCRRLGAACFERQLYGHLSVEFASFGDPRTLWTTDLRLQFSDVAALSRLLQFATNSSVDSTNLQFLTAPRNRSSSGAGGSGGRARPKTASASVGKAVAAGGRRCAALSSRLWHSGLSTVDCGVFFQLCKSRGIGFDVTDLTGTLFCLVDTVRRDRLCVLTVAEEPERARREFRRVLDAIDAELGPKAPSNFAAYHEASQVAKNANPQN